MFHFAYVFLEYSNKHNTIT